MDMNTQPTRSPIVRFALWSTLPLLAGILSAAPASGSASKPSASAPVSLPTTLPITLGGDKVAQLLKQWWAEGTAAGHLGDHYDNRDREHSGFGVANWPQLKKVIYSPEELAVRADWAAQHRLWPFVTFGNSSTSAGVTTGGSNVRMYYDSTQGIAFLYSQYRADNIYMYPEHCDHDPGHNGVGGGYGDLYPTNTPYLITSQGSSGSDQPFMRAVCSTLAAFRPEVKKKLIANGLLMPTIQMILRRSNKPIATDDDYLTAKAHPTVFEGSNVDELKMVEMAHAITADALPPIVQLKVLEEDTPVNGKDFFDFPGRTEKLADTPCVIARVWHGMAFKRTMRVSAEGSGDANRRPLTFRWVVLRGDPKTIAIKPAEGGKTAEISLSYPYRRPIADGSPIESNRVDIGVFVHNGAYWSAPAFVTFYGLDDEARTYDAAGRLREIGYGNGDTTLQVKWQALFDELKKDPDQPALKLLRAGWKDAELAAMSAAGEQYAKLAEADKDAKKKAADLSKAYQKANADVAEWTKTAASQPSDEAKAELTKAKAVQKQAQTDSEAANKASTEAGKAVEDFTIAKREDIGRSIQDVVMARLKELVESPTFLKDHAEALAKTEPCARARNPLTAARNRLAGYGIASSGAVTPGAVTPGAVAASSAATLAAVVANTATTAPDGWSSLTVYERCQIKRSNAEVLSYLLPDKVLSAPFSVYYTDARLAAPKTWRDVFTYNAAGKIAKWTRYDGQKATDIDPTNPPPMPPPPKR